MYLSLHCDCHYLEYQLEHDLYERSEVMVSDCNQSNRQSNRSRFYFLNDLNNSLNVILVGVSDENGHHDDGGPTSFDGSSDVYDSSFDLPYHGENVPLWIWIWIYDASFDGSDVIVYLPHHGENGGATSSRPSASDVSVSHGRHPLAAMSVDYGRHDGHAFVQLYYLDCSSEFYVVDCVYDRTHSH